MIFPLPLLAFIFLAQPLYRHLAAKTVRRFAALVLVFAAVCVFTVNLYNMEATSPVYEPIHITTRVRLQKSILFLNILTSMGLEYRA